MGNRFEQTVGKS